MFKRNLLASAVAGCGMAVSAIPALAQTEGAALEEVVVTATRRAESAQDVPIPVTAISGDKIERAYAQDVRDLNGIAPNVQLQPVGAFQNASAFFIRGVGSTDIESATDPGIATFIDDVYQGRVSTALQDMVDVSSVEILRGPQGTLFGRNAIGGVVHLKHNEPELEAMDFGASLLLGEEDRFDVKLMANVPLSDTVAFRIAGKSTQSDGFYKNEAPNGKDLNGQDRITVFPSLKWVPNEKWDFLLRGEYNRTRDDSWANVPYSACRTDPALGPGANDAIINVISTINPADAANFCGQEVNDDSFKVRHDQPLGSFSDFDVWGVTGRVNRYVDGFGTFTYIANYRDVEEDVVNDFDTTDYNLFHTRRIQDHYQFSHELRFASEFSDTVQVVTGLYYFEQEYKMDQYTYGALVGGGPIYGKSKQLNEAWAAFGQVDWNVTDRLTLTAGLRYSSETKDFDHCGVGFGDPNTRSCQFDLGGGNFISTLLVEDEKWTDTSPKLGANYFLTDDVMVYASYAKGFRSGGFNGRGNTPSSIGPFDEETADNYEVGMKADLMDDRLRLNASAFFMDYDDLQRATIRPAPGGAGQETVTTNAGSAENWGLELEATALVTEALTLNLTVGYLKAENKEWCSAVNGRLDDDAPPAGFTQCADSSEVRLPNGDLAGYLVPVDVSDLPPPQSPKWQTRLDVIYDFQLPNASVLTLAGNWFYRDKNSLVAGGLPAGTLDGVVQYNGEFVNPERDSSNIFDASVTWRSADQRFRVSGFVKNITDELYAGTGTFVAGLFNFTSMNNPRHWGLEVAYNM